MKRLLTLFLALGLVLALAACGGTQSSAPASNPPSSGVPAASASGAASQPGSSAPADGADLQAMMDSIAGAAALGDNPIAMMEIDLRAGEVELANVEDFAGCLSVTYAQDGGNVIVIQAKPGAAEAVKADLEKYRQSRMGNPDYAEFEQARKNTESARIVARGDIVVYAASTEGEAGQDKLDAAINEALGA